MLYIHQINGGYNISAVPKDLKELENRKLFPKEWAGLEKEQLQKISKIKTAIFCHNARFLAGAEKLEDAIKLAKIANNN